MTRYLLQHIVFLLLADNGVEHVQEAPEVSRVLGSEHNDLFDDLIGIDVELEEKHIDNDRHPILIAVLQADC